MSGALRRMIRRNGRDESGLTLLELAIVLIVIGLIMAPLLQAFRVYIDMKHRGNTRVNLSDVESALRGYYSVNGRYPCPSDRSIAFGQPGHGEEQCAVIAGLGPGTCEAGGGACRAVNGAGDGVMIGGLPYVTLSIPLAKAMDGWNKITNYAVTEGMTDAATFDVSTAAVELVNETGASVITGPVHGAVFSSGANGAGAFNIYGQSQPCIAGNREAENCDNDVVFLDALISDGQGPDYYDDYIVWSSWTQAGMWSYSNPGDMADIFSANPGNIGIGTREPRAKLEVVGNIRTEQIHGMQFCNSDGTICFPAAFIGGEGIPGQTCAANEVMYGIANNRVLCRPVAVNVPSDSCGTDQGRQTYAVGITSTGDLICELP